MALAAGTRFGPYEIAAPIGAGGMGEVYRARDTRLGRDVAIKVLPPDLTTDPDRLARLEREAKVLAALNHPNIATIHGVEENGDVRALVMELVDGETLDSLCARSSRSGRPLPRADVLAIARQIAAALETAHEKGIVHRDLKPANVKVNTSGVVKVLDFGLAKVRERGTAGPAPTTMTAAATREGVVLGTAAYMSPEQARGVAVDQSADVWAFGCVLYELLTSRRAFAGATVPDTIAAVLEHEPDWSKLPGTVPASVRQLLQRCLRKDLRQRLRDIGSVRILLEDASTALDGPSSAGDARAHSRRTGPPWMIAAVAVVSALGALAAYRYVQPPPAPSENLPLPIYVPGTITPQLSGSISPDGRHLAFVATGPSGRSMLWVRPLDSLEARELPGTEGAAHPFWSPDSRSLGFTADARIKRIDLAGGPVQTLARASGTWRPGGAWSRNDVIVFASRHDELVTVSATARGPTTTVVKADPTLGQTDLNWPDFLPDGRHFLYYVGGTDPAHRGVYVGSIDSPETKRVLESDVRAKYAAPGYLLFLQENTLFAQPFDTKRLEPYGEPRAIADGIWSARASHHASFSASQTGRLAYVNASLQDRQLVWFDRDGRRVGNVGPVFRDANGTPQLARDDRRVAIGRGELQFGDIWTLDVALGTFSPVTFGSDSHGVPNWAPDNSGLLLRLGPKVIVRNVDEGTDKTLFESSFERIADWSDDGRFVVLSQSRDLWYVDLLGDRQPTIYLETPDNTEAQAQLAPNRQWIAYTSNESGRDEVYVQSFPVPGRKRQISVDGGAMPRWRGDGGELFFVAAGQMMTAVPIRDLASFERGPPEPLFRAPLIVQGSEAGGGLPTGYDVTADGRLFLLAQPPESPPPPMTVWLNWPALLAR